MHSVTYGFCTCGCQISVDVKTFHSYSEKVKGTACLVTHGSDSNQGSDYISISVCFFNLWFSQDKI